MWARSCCVARPWRLAAIQRQFSARLPDPPRRDHGAAEESRLLWNVLVPVSGAGVAACVGYAQIRQAFKNSDEYKIQGAVNKFMEKQPQIVKDDEVVTAFVGRLKERLTGWGTNSGAANDKHCDVHATVMTGLFEAGKSTALRQVLGGMTGVLTVSLQDESRCRTAVHNAMGITTESMFTEVLRRVTKELKSVSAQSTVPVIVLEIPRFSQINIDTVSTFCKAYATDAFPGERVHVLAVMSSATAAVGFDAGGPNRQFNLFMAFNEQEAIEFLNKKMGITNNEVAASLVRMVGTNPGRLEQSNVELVAEAINKSDDEVVAGVSTKYQKRVESEVMALLAISVLDRDGKRCSVGREIASALMNSESTSHAKWRQKNITLACVAQNIKQVGGHAVYYHTEKEEWFFVSKLHRIEAERQLKALQEAEKQREQKRWWW